MKILTRMVALGLVLGATLMVTVSSLMADSSVEFKVSSGWTLISVPFIQADPSIDASFPQTSPSTWSWSGTPMRGCGTWPAAMARQAWSKAI